MSSDNMIVAHMDDTILKKSGRDVPGAGWRRDPLRPPFQTNFIWGQRFLQISIDLPINNQTGDENGFMETGCQLRSKAERLKITCGYL
jgi:hypothetical protein